MKYLMTFLALIYISLIACSEKGVRNSSRQMVKIAQVTAYTNDSVEVDLQLRTYYVLTSVKKRFNDEGKLIEQKYHENDSTNQAIRAATNRIIKKYSFDDLISMNFMDVAKEIQHTINLNVKPDTNNEFGIKINAVYIDGIDFWEGSGESDFDYAEKPDK